MTKFQKRVSGWLKRQSRIRRTVRELSALTDKDLSDFGLSRCDIHRVATEAVL